MPLLEDTRIAGSRRILINLTGSSNLGLHEVNEACSIIREAAQCDDVQINFGVIANDGMGDAVKVTVIATGFRAEELLPQSERGFFAPREEIFVESRRDPEPAPQPIEVIAVEEEEAVVVMDDFDPNDLEAPAYLRNRRLVG